MRGLNLFDWLDDDDVMRWYLNGAFLSFFYLLLLVFGVVAWHGMVSLPWSGRIAFSFLSSAA